jgi:signal transduction histidine kinase
MFSHDFRNPLASILSSNSLLRDYGERMERERQEIHYDRVEASVRRLMQMLDDMLVVAQMDIDKLEFEPESMNLEGFFNGIVNEFKIIHEQTHRIVYESDFHQDMNGDPRLLRQIATNLISNAVKYSPKGSEVRIALQQQGNFVLLTVQDYGIGIPQADQSRIFASFERASNVGQVAGTGLGLAIVRQAVELHSGAVRLESEVNVGTTITVRIPV